MHDRAPKEVYIQMAESSNPEQYNIYIEGIHTERSAIIRSDHLSGSSDAEKGFFSTLSKILHTAAAATNHPV